MAAGKIVCPECGSQEIIFGKDFIQYRYWGQCAEYPTNWYDFEYGDDSVEVEDQEINCSCQKCNHIWGIEGSVEDYLE